MPLVRGECLARKALHPPEGGGCGRSLESCKDPLCPPREGSNRVVLQITHEPSINQLLEGAQ